MKLEIIIFFILLINSVGAMIISFFGDDKWYKKHLGIFAKYFPKAKGWSVYYFLLVLWIGYLVFK